MTAKMHSLPKDARTVVRQGLDAALAQVADRVSALSDDTVSAPAFRVPEGSAFQVLAATFGLNAAEQELLALAAGCELDSGIPGAVAAAGGGQAGLTPAVAERLVGAAIWDILCPDAPLRRWRLLELRGQGPLHARVLQLDERIVQDLLGTSYLDDRLLGVVQRHSGTDTTDANSLSERITTVWSGVQHLPLILLGGPNGSGKTAAVWAATRALGAELLRLDARNIPPDASHCARLATLLDRELALTGAVVLIEAEAAQGTAAARLASMLSGPALLAAEDPPLPDRTPRVRFDYTPPDSADRRAIWAAALGRRSEAMGEHLDRLAVQFSLAPAEIEDVVSGLDPATAIDALEPALWSAARIQGRRALDGLAQRIETNANWDDLVLPAEARQQLQSIRAHLCHSWRVNGGWGWSEKSPRGLGLAALFAGASGTGKTLAAEVLATELRLDLYRIDLSQVISKYIGETEKNLARIFQAAESSGAILLFDEADALFGKRSEVKDSHDRYANIEVSYLLQRMEQYGGLAILTTNMRAALDSAFVRRLRFIINFPFPDQAARAQIWARIFPRDTPCSGLAPDRLARLNLAGGAIRSLALNATYLAAETPEPVSMKHIRRAARQEYTKLEKSFTLAEQEALR